MESDSNSGLGETSHEGSPFAYLIVIACLRLVTALQCFGVAGRYLLTELESESHIFEYLLFESRISESLAQRLDDTGAYFCLAAGILFLANLWRAPISDLNLATVNQQPAKKFWPSLLNSLELIATLLVALWFIADAFALTARGGAYSEWAIGEVAVRYACPIALFFQIKNSSGSNDKTPDQSSTRFARTSHNGTWLSQWVLTIGVSVTFAIHGYKAIQHFGPFCDLVLLTDMRLFQLDLEQSTVETAMTLIGWIDVGLAIAILLTRSRTVAIYMVGWGLITSLSRITAFGTMAWPDTLVRAANWGAALAVLLIWVWQAGKPDKNSQDL